MSKQPFSPTHALVESALWPDGPRCPRCPDSRRFVRDKSRDGSWHRCLSCYVCTSATAGTFLRGVQTPTPVALAAFAMVEADPDVKPRAISTALGVTHTVAKNMTKLWKANRDTVDGRRLAALFPEAAAAPVAALDNDSVLLHPSHPLHGLL